MGENNPNLQIVLAQEAVNSIDSLNSSKKAEFYEQMRKAREENDETAKAQGKKGYPFALSATASMAFSLFGEVLKNEGNSLGNALTAVGRIAPEAARTCSTTLDATVTHHQFTTREAQVACDRIAQGDSSTGKRIGDIVDHVSRLNAKEV